MKFAIAILLILGACAGTASAQTVSAKRAFVSATLEYLEILNDSLIYTSLSEENDTTVYFIKKDSLFLKYDYIRTGAGKDVYYVEWQAYKIIYQSKDSLFLKNNWNPASRYNLQEDTLRFVNLELLKEPITTFNYLYIDLSSPLGGSRRVSINGQGKVVFEEGRQQPPMMNEVFTVTTGELTRVEFSMLLRKLSYSLPGRLRRFRGGCEGFDAGDLTIHVQYNNKSVLSKGCGMKWPHGLLVDYLYDLDQNKGFVKRVKAPYRPRLARLQ